MAIVPKPIFKRIQFYATRLDVFEANAAAIGAPVELVETLRQQVEDAIAAFKRQRMAQAEAQAATSALNAIVKAMNHTGATIIAHTRTTASATDNPLVYGLAQIPQLRKKSPIGTPGTPTQLSTSLDAVGNLTLRWKCKNPRGAQQTMYRVHRRIGFNGPREYLGISGKKQLVDKTIPAGATSLLYEIQAYRSTREGITANFNVCFGSNHRVAAQAA